MLDTPVESTYVWLGLAVVGVAVLALAVRVPTVPPPDAAAAARTVDGVASSPHEASGEHPLDASAVRLGSARIGLRTDGGEAHAAFAYGPVVPTFDDDALRAVLSGRPPSAVFDSKAAFEVALARAETREPTWRPAPETLRVRRVNWGEVNATLVGA